LGLLQAELNVTQGAAIERFLGLLDADLDVEELVEPAVPPIYRSSVVGDRGPQRGKPDSSNSRPSGFGN
jgi:hypothetical protein